MVSQALLQTSRQAFRRSALKAPQQMRSVHIENTIDNCVPFKTGKQHKTRLAFGVSAFFVSGFSLPFIAAWFQHYKSGA
ncbi:unnamed protein product [Sympodiomycopsis kandeliae]